MCVLCECKSEYYFEVVPGWHLSRATINAKDEGIDKDDWLLTRQNTPDFIWSLTPVSKKSCSAVEYANLMYEWDYSISNMTAVCELVKVSKEVGYNTEDNFEQWLFNRIGEMLENRK
jgi:hypothetical protein